MRSLPLDELTAPSGLTVVESVDAHRAADLLGPAGEGVDGLRLHVRADDPARLNAELVAAGVRVRSLGPQVRTLEDAVLEVTSSSGDRG